MEGQFNGQEQRAFIVQLAYRMLGSMGDAEDVAQEALLRWRQAETAGVRSPRAWFTRVATRICIDRLKAAERTHVQYVGDALPEPWITPEPERRELDETLSMALLVTIQRLQPAERAAFLLHDVFGYRFDDVAEILGLQVPNCRQLAARARRHLALEQVRSDASPAEVERLTNAFFEAIDSGDTQTLRSVLAEDVVLRSDGGGKVAAVSAPLHGKQAVTKFLERVLIAARPSPVAHRHRTWINGAPGVVVTEADGQPVTAFHFLVDQGVIRGIYAQRNPDKLEHLRP